MHSLGFHVIEHRHHVTDLHATVLHQLGLDLHWLEKDFGGVICEILG